MISNIVHNFKSIQELSLTKDNTIFLAGGTAKIEELLFPKDAFKQNETYQYYTDTMGLLELREEYIKYYNIKIDKNQIIVTSGATSGLFGSLKSMLNHDDDVIILEPCWGLYTNIVNNCSANLIRFQTNGEYDWMHSLEQLQKLITKKTKVILYADPSNPTGKIMSYKWKKELLKIAQINNICVIADETYYGLNYKKDNVSIMNLDNWEDNCVCIRSMSKYFRAPGLRVGYAISNENTIKKIHDTLLGTYMVPSTTSQMLSLNILKSNEYLNWHNDECKSNLDYLLELSEKYKDNIQIIYPDAAFFVFVKVIDRNSVTIDTYRLFENCSVLTRPGNSFGDIYSDFMRICLSVDQNSFKYALQKIENLIQNGI
jgi:aspartate/methionine/tyrosine aminotransferase